MELIYKDPMEIEKRSFEIISSELKTPIDPAAEPIVKRIIHTTADFSLAESFKMSPKAIDSALGALKNGATIITDTNMAKAGIDKKRLHALSGEALCFIADDDVAAAARENKTTRAVASIDKSLDYTQKPLIFAIGNAPTALFRICDLTSERKLDPVLVVGVPVGFVNVVESKEELMQTQTQYITVTGRKGGSTVAAAIINALLRMLD